MTRLDVKNVVSSYGKTPVLKNVSVGFAKGRFTALVGPNGCGKSTLLKTIMGFLTMDEGEILLDGANLQALGRREFARQIAYLPQENHCPDHMRLGELVELAGYARYSFLGGPSQKDRQLFEQALKTVGLDGMAARRVNTLSGGQKQRAFIAMVLAQDAETILLDEPVNHLDIKYQYTVLQLVRKFSSDFGKTVIAVLHDLNMTTAFADDVVMLKDGEVRAAGPVAETITTDNVEGVFNLKTDIFERRGRLVCVPCGTEGF